MSKLAEFSDEWRRAGTRLAQGVLSGQQLVEQAELTVYCLVAFATAFEAYRAGASSGSFPCPKCHEQLRWSAAPSNGHIWAACTTARCVRVMQ